MEVENATQKTDIILDKGTNGLGEQASYSRRRLASKTRKDAGMNQERKEDETEEEEGGRRISRKR